MKFHYVRRKMQVEEPRILDIGCGNNSPSVTKHWFKGCHYSGADIAVYRNNESDLAAMDEYYQVGVDGSGYDAIPDESYDFIILHHVVEHMSNAAELLAVIAAKLKPGGYIWIAFPSYRSLSLPSASGTLQFCDDATHVYLPDPREITNVLLSNQVKVIHAGRSRDFLRTLLGALILPLAVIRKLSTGKLSSKGLWYILGFEDHVFGQRRA